MQRRNILATLSVSLVLSALGEGQSRAQGGIPACATLPNPIYMVGTTAVEPLVRRLGAKLAQLDSPQTLLWNQNTDGCSSVTSLIESGDAYLNRSTFNYYTEVPVAGTNTTKIVTQSCNANLNGIGDLVINDVFYSSCVDSYSVVPPKVVPSAYKEFAGPVQGLVPIVPSSYYYYYDLTAEEALDLWICGASGNILTFSNNLYIYDYNCIISGMRELWANSLGVVGGLFTHGIGAGCNNNMSATEVLNAVAAASSSEATIGYTSTEVYDDGRDKVKALKLRGVGQERAYLPDTDLTSRDKINVREGRYTSQGALKLVAHVDATGTPDNPAAKKMIDWLQDNPVQDPTLQLPFSIIDIYAQSGVVPQCAMKVTKDNDAPVFRPYRPERPCNCYFESQATGARSIVGCVPCSAGDASTGCPDGQVCSYGYCE